MPGVYVCFMAFVHFVSMRTCVCVEKVAGVVSSCLMRGYSKHWGTELGNKKLTNDYIM